MFISSSTYPACSGMLYKEKIFLKFDQGPPESVKQLDILIHTIHICGKEPTNKDDVKWTYHGIYKYYYSNFYFVFYNFYNDFTK